MGRSLGVRDFGRVGPLQSQAIWHALAAEAAGPMLTFMRPASPYVSLGMHRHPGEIDLGYLAERGIPLLRRYAGGGPVYLDDRQLFFQIYLPKEMARGPRAQLLETLLEPAASAFRSIVAGAELDGYGEISAGVRKLCGHGAAEIGRGVVVVGNVVESFDAASGSGILKLHPSARELALRLMDRFVGPASEIDAGARFIEEMTGNYLQLFQADGVTEVAEETLAPRLAGFERELANPGFVAGAELGIRPPGQPASIKVRAGVQLLVAEAAGWLAMATVVFGRLEAVEVVGGGVELSGRDALGFLARVGPEPGRALLRRLEGLELAA